jgi:hypothetical protein
MDPRQQGGLWAHCGLLRHGKKLLIQTFNVLNSIPVLFIDLGFIMSYFGKKLKE